MSEQPELPYYDGSESSSGHSGSDTSASAARQADTDGTTKAMQAEVLDLLSAATPGIISLGIGARMGITVKELREQTGWHHGNASRVLSDLHKTGSIARLTEVRNRCKVYVLPYYVMGREVEQQGHTSTTVMLDEMYALLNEAQRTDANAQDSLLHRQWHTRANDVMRRYEGRPK
jgi:DNA-binding MarR family transcriptional regulator